VAFFGKSPLFGLDIGSSAIKAVRLRKKQGTIHAERAGITAMPAGALSGGQFLDPPAVANAIRKFCRRQRLGGRQVAVAVGGEDLFLTRLKLPRGADNDDVGARVLSEAISMAPFPLHQANLDFHTLNDSADTGMIDALVVAVKRARVESLREVLHRAGKTPIVVDSTACCLANAFQFNYDPEPGEISALLHLGADMMTICIVRGSTPLLSRDLPLAPPLYSDENWNLSERVAVQLERVFEMLDEIADEHPLEPGSSKISRIWLSGGGTRLRGLEEVLRDRIRLPFEEMNPFRNIQFDSASEGGQAVLGYGHCMAVAVGLALRNFDEL